MARPSDERPTQLTTDHIGLLAAGLVMMIGGWGGLALLVTTSLPRLGLELWLFFLLLHIAITGTVMPVVRYLNLRFTPPDMPPPAGGIIVRQSVWVGLFVVIAAWLQILRVLSLPIAGFLVLGFVVVEFFLRARERDID